MKAIVYKEYGSPDVLRLVDVEKPSPGADEVLVEVLACSLNALDWRMLRGKPALARVMAGGLIKPKRQTPGADFAGRVAAVGAAVSEFRVGDAVFGVRGKTGGALAEYVCTTQDRLVAKPRDVSFEEAAAVPVAGVGAGVRAGVGTGVAAGVGDGEGAVVGGAADGDSTTVASGVGTGVALIEAWLGDATAPPPSATDDGTTATAGRSNPPRTSRNPTDMAAAAISTSTEPTTAADGPRRGGATAIASPATSVPRRYSGQLLCPVVRQTSCCWRADWGVGVPTATQRFAGSGSSTGAAVAPVASIVRRNGQVSGRGERVAGSARAAIVAARCSPARCSPVTGGTGSTN